MIDTETNQDTGNYSFIGGQLCLDFTNTMSEYKPTPREDKLNYYADLVSWGIEAGLISSEEAKSLIREAEREPEKSRAVFAQAHALRDAIHNIFSALAVESVPDTDDLATLNAALSKAMCHARIVSPGADGHFKWDWASNGDELDRVLWPVARSAADLLTSEEQHRVRECAGDTCGWLFLDMSRNHSRHWCDMRDCGNRAKARRFYRRKRDA